MHWGPAGLGIPLGDRHRPPGSRPRGAHPQQLGQRGPGWARGGACLLEKELRLPASLLGQLGPQGVAQSSDSALPGCTELHFSMYS